MAEQVNKLIKHGGIGRRELSRRHAHKLVEVLCPVEVWATPSVGLRARNCGQKLVEDAISAVIKRDHSHKTRDERKAFMQALQHYCGLTTEMDGQTWAARRKQAARTDMRWQQPETWRKYHKEIVAILSDALFDMTTSGASSQSRA
jgi:hypothetical protein